MICQCDACKGNAGESQGPRFINPIKRGSHQFAFADDVSPRRIRIPCKRKRSIAIRRDIVSNIDPTPTHQARVVKSPADDDAAAKAISVRQQAFEAWRSIGANTYAPLNPEVAAELPEWMSNPALLPKRPPGK